MGKMPSRKFHGKTKSGCACCKARHVKCDEGRPTCNNCKRREAQCVYAETTPSRPQLFPDSWSPSSTTANAPDSFAGTFDSLDLFLMHHYTVSTSRSLMPTESAQWAWQVDVPAKAQDNIVLHHGILALAAMDLARDKASRSDLVQMARFRSRGLQHQQVALELYRELLSQKAGTDQHVIFIFSIMLVILAFASALSAETRPTLDEILDLFMLFRGPKVFWREYSGGINMPWINAMFPQDTENLRFGVPGEEVRFVELEKLSVDAACADAVSRLKFTCRCFWARPVMDVKSVAWFPALIADQFIRQLRQHQFEALAILKAYAANMVPFQERWWIGSWSSILESAIADALVQEGMQASSLPDVGDLLVAPAVH